MNRKILMFSILGVLLLGFGGAMLVEYISNTVSTDIAVESPIEILMIDGDISEIIAGESNVITTTIRNKANVPIEGILTEIKVLDFDGVGITIEYSDASWTGNIPVCDFEDDAYYYIGAAEGFTLPAGITQSSSVTITTDAFLEPIDYQSEIRSINVLERKC